MKMSRYKFYFYASAIMCLVQTLVFTFLFINAITEIDEYGLGLYDYLCIVGIALIIPIIITFVGCLISNKKNNEFSKGWYISFIIFDFIFAIEHLTTFTYLALSLCGAFESEYAILLIWLLIPVTIMVVISTYAANISNIVITSIGLREYITILKGNKFTQNDDINKIQY